MMWATHTMCTCTCTMCNANNKQKRYALSMGVALYGSSGKAASRKREREVIAAAEHGNTLDLVSDAPLREAPSGLAPAMPTGPAACWGVGTMAQAARTAIETVEFDERTTAEILAWDGF